MNAALTNEIARAGSAEDSIRAQISAEAERATAAEQKKVPTDGNHTVNGVKTFTQSPLVPTVASTDDSSQKSASTGWVTRKLTDWWNSIKQSAVTFGRTVTSSGGFIGNVTGNVTGTASGNLPLTGGKITGYIRRGESINWAITGSNTTTQTRLLGGTNEEDGGFIVLSGKDNNDEPGFFKLVAKDGDHQHLLIGKPNGSLKWGSNEIVRENVVPHNSAIASIAFPSSATAATMSAFDAIENGRTFTAPTNGWLSVACEMSIGSRLSLQSNTAYYSGYTPSLGGVIGITLPVPKGITVTLVLVGSVLNTYRNNFISAIGEVY